MSREFSSASRKERILIASPGLLAALLWAFTALYLRPGLSYLLALGLLLLGVALISVMTLHWASRRISSRNAAVALAYGALVILFAGVQLAYIPESMPEPMRFIFLLLLLIAIAIWRRSTTQGDRY
jgi:uncharacterized membrane protein YfcA